MKKVFMKKCLAMFFVTFFTLNAFSQQAAKSVYVELGGPGLFSANYDMRFQKREDGLGFRAGVGGFSVRNDYYDGSERISLITVPVGLNYLFGKDGKHYFEVGAGATYVHLSSSATYNDESDVFRGSFGHMTFGYRLQPTNGGFTFRAAITPVFGSGYFIPYYAGVSFGYKF